MNAPSTDLDEWSGTGPTTRRHLITFLSWACQQHILRDVDVPVTSTERVEVSPPGPDARLAAIRRLLLDETLALGDRLAGCLVTLSGQQASKIAAPRTTDTFCAVGAARLKLGAVPANLAAQTGRPGSPLCRQACRARRNRGNPSGVVHADADQMKGMFSMGVSAITGRRMLAAWCLASVALLPAACGSSGTTASPGTSATPAKTNTATITPSSPPETASPGSSAPLPCSTTDLKLTVGVGNGAAGTVYYPLDFTNTSSAVCTTYGYPGVAFVSSPGGSQVGAPAGRASNTAPALVTLAPGAVAHATLAVSDVLIGNNCLHHQVQVHWVQVYPPDQYSALFARLRRQGCADRSLVTMHVNTVSGGP